MAITRGDVVEATTAGSGMVMLRALGAPHPERDLQGHDSPAVLVCTEEEWDRAQVEGRQPEGIPWPLDAVRELTTA